MDSKFDKIAEGMWSSDIGQKWSNVKQKVAAPIQTVIGKIPYSNTFIQNGVYTLDIYNPKESYENVYNAFKKKIRINKPEGRIESYFNNAFKNVINEADYRQSRYALGDAQYMTLIDLIKAVKPEFLKRIEKGPIKPEASSTLTWKDLLIKTSEQEPTKLLNVGEILQLLSNIDGSEKTQQFINALIREYNRAGHDGIIKFKEGYNPKLLPGQRVQMKIIWDIDTKNNVLNALIQAVTKREPLTQDYLCGFNIKKQQQLYDFWNKYNMLYKNGPLYYMSEDQFKAFNKGPVSTVGGFIGSKLDAISRLSGTPTGSTAGKDISLGKLFGGEKQ